MGLFGIVKTTGEEVRADVKEWMGTDYFVASAIAAGGAVVEEFTNAFMQTTLSLSGWKALAYGTIHRLVFSALYYFGGKQIKKPLYGLTASIMPVTLIFIDGINHLMKGTAQEKGASLALSLWRKTATTSVVPPSTPVNVSVTPAPTPVSVSSGVIGF